MTVEGTPNQQQNQHNIQQKNINPDAEALCQLAAQQLARREYTHALISYQQAAKLAPKCIAAYLGMADLFVLHGNHNYALQTLSYALNIEPENSQARRRMAPLLAALTPAGFNPELDRDLLLCISEPDNDHQQLARVIGIHLSNKYHELQTASTGIINPTLLSSLNSDKLFLAYLSQCINTNVALEQWLTKLRRSLLLAGDNINLPELTCALALQCFANEYLFSVSAEEEQCLMEIEWATDKLTAQPNTLLVSMYRPLIDIVSDIKSFEHNNQPFLSLLIKRTLLDLQQEQHHQTRFRKIGNNSAEKIIHSVSDQVRNQYEENPYPRWQIPPAPTPIALTRILQQLPGVKHERLPSGNISALIAGCGTGFEPIELARMDKSAQITALDLSSKSLAYAKRMADELRISNIDFVQGNILDAAELNTQFDLITSTGVLHHMENPQTGWQTLCGILKPDGVMRISLYSEFARRRVVLAHQKIKELQLSSSNNDIKTFRSTIFSQPPGSPLAELAQSDDFYSVSGCRDLLFHVHEHRFTLLQLKDIIAELGLIVIGFDVPFWARQKFNQRYPNNTDALDLTKWHEFEVSHPDTFVGMYQLWLQKINPTKY